MTKYIKDPTMHLPKNDGKMYLNPQNNTVDSLRGHALKGVTPEGGLYEVVKSANGLCWVMIPYHTNK